MADTPIKMPQLSDTMTEGVLVSWTKKVGEAVRRGDIVASVETDKAIMDVEVFRDGFLSGPIAEPGTTVPVGAVIGFLVDDAESVRQGMLEAHAGDNSSHAPASVDSVHGDTTVRMPPPSHTNPSASPAPRPSHAAASPLARRVAGQLGVDLAGVTPTHGVSWIQAADVVAAAAPIGRTPGPPSALPEPRGPSRSMTPLEAATARSMAASLSMPTFRVTVAISLSGLQKAAKAASVSLTVAIARACALSMAKVPKLNTAWAPGDRVAEPQTVDVGLAVAVEGGLVVPVLRDVGRRELTALARDWEELIGRARTRRLKPQDWEHPTFTVSNMGMLGVDHFDAIPTAGTGAILAISKAGPDGKAPFCLSSDHRVINGADAAAWLQGLKTIIEHPDTWLERPGPRIPEGTWDFDVLVLGGGPGGEDCARGLAQNGIKVALVNDAPFPGGECLWRGCIPSKTWRHAADRIRDRAGDARLGVHGTATPSLDWKVLEEARRSILQGRGETALKTDRAVKVTYVRGRGSYVDAHTLLVDERGASQDPHLRAAPPGEEETMGHGDTRRLRFGATVIATGAPPWVPPIPGAALGSTQGSLLTSDSVWFLAERPTRMVIIGCGAIGAEMAQIFADFGTEILVLEARDRILAEVDEEIGHELAAILCDDPRIEVKTQATIRSISGPPGQVEVLYTTADGSEHQVVVDVVLAATGKRPRTEGLGLEQLGVTVDRGAIVVDDRCRTNVPHVYAVGDVVPGFMLAHTAAQQGRVAASQLLGHDLRYDEKKDCGVIFTRPQAAFVGLSLAQCKALGIDAAEVKSPMRGDAKAEIAGESHGQLKLVADPKTHRILGAHLLADHADTLIGEAVLMVGCGLTLDQVAQVIHPHPTQTEIWGEMARRLLLRLQKRESRG